MAWRAWWNEYNEVYFVGNKPVNQEYQRDIVAFDDPLPAYVTESVVPTGFEDTVFTTPSTRQGFRQGTSQVSPGRRMRYECLLAGTPVWTSSGRVPIERIQIGDLVLSQDPETGELAYKPVLQTTLRPPVRLLKVVIGGQALQCSGGHPFWIAGEGWVKARDLKEGARLHSVRGSTEVRSVHATGIEETHNLIVADFHTYFAGEAKLLIHDNTIRAQTNTILPGLAQP